MKYLVIVTICLLGLIKVSYGMTSDATEIAELDPAAKAFLEAMRRVDSIRENTPPDLSVTRPAQYGSGPVALSNALMVPPSMLSDSVYYYKIFVKYEVDSLGHFTTHKVEVSTWPDPCNNTAITEEIRNKLLKIENNWLPAVQKGRPVTTVDSLCIRYDRCNTRRPM